MENPSAVNALACKIQSQCRALSYVLEHPNLITLPSLCHHLSATIDNLNTLLENLTDPQDTYRPALTEETENALPLSAALTKAAGQMNSLIYFKSTATQDLFSANLRSKVRSALTLVSQVYESISFLNTKL